MCHPFKRVYDRTSKIVGWIDFPFITRAMVREHIATINDRVPEGFIGVVDAYFGTQAPSLTLFGTRLHFSKTIQVLSDTSIAPLRWNTMPTLVRHFRHFSVSLGRAGAWNVTDNSRVYVICVGLAGLNHGHCEIIKMIEIIRCVRDAVSTNVQ